MIYNPEIVNYERLVNLAMERLDECMYKLNQVGNEWGTQYFQSIYYHNDEHKDIATQILDSFGKKCVIECKPGEKFWDGEEYHQQYLLNGGQNTKKNDEVTICCYG